METESRLSKKILLPGVVLAVMVVVWLSLFFSSIQSPQSKIDAPLLPQLSLPSGAYVSDFPLKLSPPPGTTGQIIYTTNGRYPTHESAIIYKNPIPLSAAEPNVTVIRARMVLPNGSLSDESVGTYFMTIETELPRVSIVADPDDLWSSERGILANRIMRGSDWERPAHMTYLDENGRFGFSEPVGIRLHGQGSSFTDKQSLRLYFRREYGPGRLNYPLYSESEVTSFDRLVLHSGGQDNALYAGNWTLMRTQLIAKLAQDLNTYTTHNQPVLTFLNGELYGLYYLRERIDETYFQDYHDIDQVKILNAPHRDQDQPKEVEDWWQLEAYAAEHDLADPEQYAYVLSQIDVGNMIDHYILQMYAANTDWPYNNDILFRGSDPLSRWQWFLWDVDYSFGMLPASNLEFDMVTWLMDPQSTRVRAAARFFRSLWQNPDFQNRFLVRTADLLNTTLSPENVSKQLAGVRNSVEADIGYEIARWGSAGNWYDSADGMQIFAEHRADIMRQHFIDGFGLAGTAVITLNPPAASEGTLTPLRPVTGNYFLNTTITMTANPKAGYQFAGWEINGERVEAEPTLKHTITQDTTITPYFMPIP